MHFSSYYSKSSHKLSNILHNDTTPYSILFYSTPVAARCLLQYSSLTELVGHAKGNGPR